MHCGSTMIYYCTREPIGKLKESIHKNMYPACKPHCFGYPTTASKRGKIITTGIVLITLDIAQKNERHSV